MVGVARHSEKPDDEYVVYKALYSGEYPPGQLWVRPTAMFLETIERDGKTMKRFEFIGP